MLALDVGAEEVDLALIGVGGGELLAVRQLRQLGARLPVRRPDGRRVAPFAPVVAVAALQEEAVALRRHQPPATLELLRAEPARRLQPQTLATTQIAVVRRQIRSHVLQRLPFRRRLRAQLRVRRHLARPALLRALTIPVNRMVSFHGRQRRQPTQQQHTNAHALLHVWRSPSCSIVPAPARPNGHAPPQPPAASAPGNRPSA